VTSVFVVPAAIALLVSRSVRGLLATAVAIGVAQGVVGLYLSVWIDVPPGPAIALLGALAYGCCAAVLALRPRRRMAPA
jgi:ABC-type Mn2+/Zn2+ transport system permease subunit